MTGVRFRTVCMCPVDEGFVMRHRILMKTCSILVFIACSIGVSSIANAGDYNSGEVRYFSGSTGSDPQCAWGQIDVEVVSGDHATSYSWTGADHSVACWLPFNLPAGWLLNISVLQVKLGGSWYDVGTTSEYSTITTSSWGNGYVLWNPPMAMYRAVSGHSVAVAGGWQSHLMASPGYS